MTLPLLAAVGGLLCLVAGLLFALAAMRRERHQLALADVHRREFLAAVSHTLGTPLAAVMGWTDLLVDDVVKEPDERSRLLRRIQRNVHEVARTVRQMLELSRWEGGKPELHIEAFPLVEPLMEAAATLEAEAADTGAALRFEAVDPHLHVLADRGRVRELIQILLDNVAAHAGQAVVRMASEDARVHLIIEDAGKGSGEAHRAMRGERDISSRSDGAGLAMTVAARLIEGHGGKLRVEPRPNGGTRVSFDLPRG